MNLLISRKRTHIVWVLFHCAELFGGTLVISPVVFCSPSYLHIFVPPFNYIRKVLRVPITRPDKNGTHRAQFDRNKKIIYKTQTTCGICGRTVDFTHRFPHPLSPCIDHIIPVAKGGHPSDIANMQLAHFTCNRQKSDKIVEQRTFSSEPDLISNRLLPLTFDWKNIN